MPQQDLLSLSLSQPLPTDHYTLHTTNGFLDPLDPFSRSVTPSGESGSGSGEGRKKGKKKKKRGARADGVEPVEEGMAFAVPDVEVPLGSETRDQEVHLVVKGAESEDCGEKESIIVEPWIPPTISSPLQPRPPHVLDSPTHPRIPHGSESPTHRSIKQPTTPASPPTTARHATPIQCNSPTPTILSEFPLLSHLPSMIPIPSIRDVKAAGRATQRAGMAFVGSVRDGYGGLGQLQAGYQKDGKRQVSERSATRRGSETFDSSEGSDRSSLASSSDAEVLVDAEDAEGMTEISWAGVPDEGTLGVGWMRWRGCWFERYDTPSGERRLLISTNPTPHTALQITDCTSLSAHTSPLHMLHPETIDMANSSLIHTAPFEVLHLPTHRPSGSGRGKEPGNVFRCEECEVLDGVGGGDDLRVGEEDEEVLVDCTLLRPVEGSLRWIFLTIVKRGKVSYGQNVGDKEDQVFLSVFDARTRRVENKVFVGRGIGGQVASSPVALVVTIAGQTPMIHFLSPSTLRPILRPITSNIGVNTRTGLPVISLNGRFFAHATIDKRPTRPIQRGSQDRKLGTIVTAASNQTFYTRTHDHRTAESHAGSPSRAETLQPANSPTMQSIVLNTAAGLGTEVAKGMWTGLKGLGTAAIQGASQSEALSKNAPGLSSLAQRYSLSQQNGGRGGLGKTDGLQSTAKPQQQSRFPGGSWIKVLDLKSSQTSTPGDREPSREKAPRKRDKAKLISHFAIPASDVISVPHPAIGNPTIDVLSFSPGGTSLAVGTSDGRSSFVVELRPAGSRVRAQASDGEPNGEVWMRYELRRGVTPAVVEKIEWSACGSWIGIGTRRTIHVYAIHPAGGRVSPLQIRSPRPLNPEQLAPLSVRVSPALRIRRPRGILIPSTKASAPPSPGKTNAGVPSVPHKLAACRVPARSFFFGPPVVANGKHGEKNDVSNAVLRTLNVFDPTKRILRSEAIYIARDAQTIRPTKAEASKPDELKLASSIFRAWKMPSEPYSLYFGDDAPAPKSVVRNTRAAPFANAEIQTYSTSPHILPRPIYRENWIRFASICPGPDGSPTEYQYRVTVDPTVPGQGTDVDLLRPLAKAVGTQMDFYPSMPMIPALPNGAGKEPSRWHTSIGTFVHARDIVRMRRKDSSLTSTSVTSGASPASYGERLISDTDAGAIFDVGAGETGNEPDDMTNGSTSGDTRDDEWDDDLVTGVMDDELHHGAYALANGTAGANGHGVWAGKEH